MNYWLFGNKSRFGLLGDLAIRIHKAFTGLHPTLLLLLLLLLMAVVAAVVVHAVNLRVLHGGKRAIFGGCILGR